MLCIKDGRCLRSLWEIPQHSARDSHKPLKNPELSYIQHDTSGLQRTQTAKAAVDVPPTEGFGILLGVKEETSLRILQKKCIIWQVLPEFIEVYPILNVQGNEHCWIPL